MDTQNSAQPSNTQHTAMVEVVAKCHDEAYAGRAGGCMVTSVLVIAGLVIIIVLQWKMLKCLKKGNSKKK